MNVLSIGDSTVERTAITEVMWSSQYEAAATRSAFSGQLCLETCEQKPENLNGNFLARPPNQHQRTFAQWASFRVTE